MAKPEDSTLKGRIKIAMRALGIDTGAQLRRRMGQPGVSKQAISNWLNGIRTNLEPEMIFRLSRTLKVNPEWLLFGPPHGPTPPRVVTTEDQEILDMADTMDKRAKDQWLSSGRTMVQLTTEASAANPFGPRRK